MDFYAHYNSANKELLIDHLRMTGDLAAEFASRFGFKELGLQLGLLHDVGKHTERFQDVLNGKVKKIDHAVVAAECYAEISGPDICADDFIYLT